MSSQNIKLKKTPRRVPPKRTPRTLTVENKRNNQMPILIPESFNLKNFDLIGKIDDMRSLTKELSIMARQLEQWVGVAYTVGMAFKDNKVLKDVIKAIATIGTGAVNGKETATKKPEPKHRNNFPFPLPLPPFGAREEEENYSKENNETPTPGMNIFEIINNPAFQEIVSKLFLQKK